MSAGALDAKEITRASKSNLALAFISLPRERRQDITTFYAWCRVIDDIADDPGQTAGKRRGALDLWKNALCAPTTDESELAPQVRALIAKYKIETNHFVEIIQGVEMDLDGVSYATWDELKLYCHRVASVVGLISIEIFGYRDPACRRYATELGLALQLTNILRDVGEDHANGGRIYLPRDDMAGFGYTLADLSARRNNEAFQALMRFETNRALGFYAAAVAALPRIDRRSMIAAEIMRGIYSRLLLKMRRDGYRVFQKRYSLSRWEKAAVIARTTFISRFV